MSAIDIGINGGWRPCSMRLDLDAGLPNENTILRYLAAGRFYEPDVAQVFLKVLREGDTVIDIGANAGFFTALAAALVGPTGRVVSFEPDQANCARLQRNIEVNSFGHVTLIERPASDRAGPVDFFINSDDSGGSALWNPAEFPGNVRSRGAPRIVNLEGTTIDAEVARLGLSRVKLLKIDTEGADHKVLCGARQLLSNPGVPFVVSELHEFGLHQMGSSQRSFLAHMTEAGYDSFMLYYNGSLPRLVPSGTTIQTKVICNILFSSRQELAACWPNYLHDPAGS
jgi:FkbM family methyltransferase